MTYVIKDHKIGALPAFAISLVVFIAIIFVFELIEVENNAYLIQAELVLTLLALSLTGILTRSKLKSLLVIVAVPIAYVVPRAIGMFSPWVYFTEFTRPDGVLTKFVSILSDLTARTGGTLPTDLDRAQELMRQYGPLIDLGVLFICAVCVALLVTTLVTGVGRGFMVIISLIIKLIAVLFLIFFLFILPFFYLALATATEGVSYAGIGASHSFLAMEELSDPLDPNIDYDYILSELDQASPAFLSASNSFEVTENNFLADFALRYFGYDKEFQSIKHFLRSGSYLTAPEGLGEFILGFRDFREGLNITMSQVTLFGPLELPSHNVKIAAVMNQQDDNFTQGLDLLDSGLAHFRKGLPNILKALDEVQTGAELLTDLNNPDIDLVVAQIPLAKNAIIVMGQVSESVIPLVNGTYLMTRAFSSMTENHFTDASSFVYAARTEIVSGQQLLLNISQDIDEENTLSPVPFAVYAIRDLATIASSLVAAANYAIDTFLSLSDEVFLLMNLDLANLASINWVQIETQLDFAYNNVTQADNNLIRAQSNASEFMQADYGPLNSTFHPIMGTLNESITQISSIVGDAVTLVGFMNNLYLAVFHFAQGADFMQNAQYIEAELEFEASITSAETALGLLDDVENLDESMVSSITDILTDLITVATLAREAVQNLESDPDLIEEYEIYLDLLEDLFGTGFGSLFTPPLILAKAPVLKHQTHAVHAIGGSDKNLSNGYNSNRKLIFQPRTYGVDWTIFNCLMLVNLFGIRKIDKQVERKLLIQKMLSIF